MSQYLSRLSFGLAVLAGLGNAAAQAADAPSVSQRDPCAGSVVAPAAARPRMTLHSVTGTDERALLSWDAVPGATEYRIYREPSCPAQARVQVASVGGNVTTWSDRHPSPKAWYSVETTQSAGTGLARLSNPVFFDASKAAARKTTTPTLPATRPSTLAATPPNTAASAAAPAAGANGGGNASDPRPAKYAPMKLLSVKATPEGPLLTWEAVAGSKEYRVSREFAGSGRNEQIATTAGNITQWTDKGQGARALYSVKSVPSDSRQPMGASNAIEFIPGAVVPPPTPRALGVPLPVAAGVKPLLGTPAPVPAVAHVTAPPPVGIGPTDTLDKPFHLDGKPPQRESFGVGMSSAGTVQVSLQWQGGPLTVSLRPAGGNPVDSKPVNGGKAELSFAVSAAQVAQSLIWFVTVESPGVAQGQVHIVSPKADRARMNAAMAEAKSKAEQQRQQPLTQAPNAQAQAALQARIASLQKAQADATAASHQRIRAHQQQLMAARGGSAARALLGGANAPAPKAVSTVRLSNLPGMAARSALLGGSTKSTISGTLSDVPYADTVAPQAIFPDTTLTVQGAHFQADDEVFFIMPTGEVRAQRTYVGVTQMLLKVPGYTSTGLQTAYFYIVYKRNGQAQRTDNAFAIQLQPTTPVLSGIALSDPNDTGPIRPQKVVTLLGSGFAPDDKVVLLLQNKEFDAAPFDSAYNSDAQLMVTVPSTVPTVTFADTLQAQMYVRRKSGALSAKLSLALAPELEQRVLDVRQFADELRRDSPTESYPDWNGNLRKTSFTGVIFGDRLDHIYFNTTALKNGWLVKTVSMVEHYCIAEHVTPKWDAFITETTANTARLYVKVHYWAEPTGNWSSPCTYALQYTIEGPKGMPSK